MIYQPGDYVYPADLPHPFLCRVDEAQTADCSNGSGQILRLEPPPRRAHAEGNGSWSRWSGPLH